MTATGKLLASLMAALAEFERDLLRERVRSGIAVRLSATSDPRLTLYNYRTAERLLVSESVTIKRKNADSFKENSQCARWLT